MPPRPKNVRPGPAEAAAGIALVIFDLDGVIYRGRHTLPHAVESIRRLSAQGVATQFLTNNSTQSRMHYVRRLRGLGIDCGREDIMSSAYATALYLQEKGYAGARVLVVGERGLATELRLAGLEVIDEPHGHKVDVVVVGLDRRFTYHKLARAQQAIFRGARFIATNSDTTFPAEDHILPGGGAVMAAIQAASGVKPVVIGKPGLFMFRKLLQAAKIPAERALMIGDRLDTDVAVGRRAGVWTALVLTGVTKREEVARQPASERPDWIIDDLRGLRAILSSPLPPLRPRARGR